LRIESAESFQPWFEGVRPQPIDGRHIASPAFVLVEQHQPQRRRIDRAVVRRMRDLVRSCQLAGAQLMQDLARGGIAELIHLGCLEPGQDR